MSKQRYVIVRGQVFRWEEKAPFVESGKSVQGALEYDIETKTVKCHECGKWFAVLGAHCRSGCGPTAREYKLRHGLQLQRGMVADGATSQTSLRMREAWATGKLNREEASERIKNIPLRTPLPPEVKQNIALEGRNLRNACPPQCQARISKIIEELGRSPTMADAGPTLVRDALTHFNTWTEAVQSVGAKPKQIGKYSNIVLIELLRDFYVLNSRTPRKDDWATGGLPSATVYYRAFGSMLAAYAAAGLGKVAQEKVA